MPPEDWDTQLIALGGSFIQSRPWAQFQHDLGRELVWGQGDGYQWLATLRRSHGITYLLSSYGPTARDAAAMKAAVMSLKQAGRDNGADFVRVEPQTNITAEQLQNLGGRKIHEFSPQHTRTLDLMNDNEALRGALASGHRNLINGTERRNIKISLSNDAVDIDTFLAMLHDTASRSGVRFWPDSYFRQLFSTLQPSGIAKLYLARVNDQPVAAALFYDWDGTRYYAHAGAFQEQNREAKASVSLVWQAIQDAKRSGRHRFDLWGVAPAGDNQHSLAGISRFKNAFGGVAVDYAGTWDIPLKPTKYWLYSWYRRFRGLD